MILTHHNPVDGTYSAATSLGIIAYNLDFESAADAIVNAVEGLELQDAYALLQSPAPAAGWRATLAAAMASDLSSLDQQLESLATAADSELVLIKEQLAKVVSESAKEKNRQREIDSLRQRIQEVETDVRAALIKQFGDSYNPYWVTWATRFERARLAELEVEYGANAT